MCFFRKIIMPTSLIIDFSISNFVVYISISSLHGSVNVSWNALISLPIFLVLKKSINYVVLHYILLSIFFVLLMGFLTCQWYFINPIFITKCIFVFIWIKREHHYTAAWKGQIKKKSYLFGRVTIFLDDIAICSDESVICLDELRLVLTNNIFFRTTWIKICSNK